MIVFHFYINFKLAERKKIKSWIKNICCSEKKELTTLAYIFCDDNYLLGVNKKYLGHETLTDVITFDYSKEKKISGDILISIDQVKVNAKKYSVTTKEELYRVMAHGLLHLLGYNDKGQKEKKVMREKESFYLKKIINT